MAGYNSKAVADLDPVLLLYWEETLPSEEEEENIKLFRPSVDAFKAILTRDLTLPEENHVFWYVTKIGEERPEGWWWKKASKTWDERVYLELLQWNKGQTGFSKTTEELKIKTWTNWLSIPISAFF